MTWLTKADPRRSPGRRRRRLERELRHIERYPHRVVPTLALDTAAGPGAFVSWDVTCDAPATAWCRQSPHDERCDCEEYVGEKRPDGTWVHAYTREDDDGVEHEEMHLMRGGEECHIQEHLLVNGPSDVAEMYEGDDGTPVRSGRIDLTWQGDCYSWEYAPPLPAS